MEDTTQNTKPNQQLTVAHTEQMFQMLQLLNKTNVSIESSSLDLKMVERLTYQNYTMWCKLMYVVFRGRGRLYHIIDEPSKST